MKNSNKIKWGEEFLIGVPILVGIILSIYIGATFWGYVVLIITIICFVITHIGLLGRLLSNERKHSKR